MTSRSAFIFILSACLLFIPSVIASAASQFNLDTNFRASKCWVSCHSMVTSTVMIPELGRNEQGFLVQNCQLDSYVDLMARCFAHECESAPDAAYAAEFAETICRKTGYAREFALPKAYVLAAKEYFESEAYLTGGGVRGIKVWGPGDIFFVLSSLFVASLFL